MLNKTVFLCDICESKYCPASFHAANFTKIWGQKRKVVPILPYLPKVRGGHFRAAHFWNPYALKIRIKSSKVFNPGLAELDEIPW